MDRRVSTGLGGLDRVVDMLRLGDNVVWQVQSIEDYRRIVDPYVERTRADGRRLIYMRFGEHEPLLDHGVADRVCALDASQGFERFATEVHSIIAGEGERAFYVFDCLSDLLGFWYSDLMIGNFFRVTCPFLFELDTIAYFALTRSAHTYDTVARIRETTQLLLDLYLLDGELYIHPLKVWERYSPTMFFPHQIDGDEAVSITASAEAAGLFSHLEVGAQARDYWEETIERTRHAARFGDPDKRALSKALLLHLMIGREPRMLALCERYFTLEDLLAVAGREIGTGRIGGKSVGMLLARKILKTDAADTVRAHWESHDSYYLGSDIFYTYIVQNGWWDLHIRQRTPEGYFTLAPLLREKLLSGRFPAVIREQFTRMLEHFGQSPIIVRSSSLLEDNYGNAFAGKYESVFCANQGSPSQRYTAFEQAVRTVYASTMGEDALAYRRNRGLTERDEQMAILVQRVSGDHFGGCFFPHLAGMGNSRNLYLWDKDMDPDAGMLRLVFGLGTRAVDRVSGDYARIVALDNPRRRPPVSRGDEKKFSQHSADLLDLWENRLDGRPVDELAAQDLRLDKGLLFTPDLAERSRLHELGYTDRPTPMLLDFHGLLTRTPFPDLARTALSALEAAYEYPVDIEFTVNFARDGTLKFNLLQCRPLQTKGLGRAIEMPEPPRERVLIETRGDFMGGNARLDFACAVLVRAEPYLKLSLQEKYQTARLIGELNTALRGEHALLIGPGRWGTTTPSLGVPVHFTELCHMAAVCEVSYRADGLVPELSYGSHFFQDIVESDIFYAAVFDGDEGVTWQPDLLLAQPNLLRDLVPAAEPAYEPVIQVVRLPGLTLCADLATQRLVCYREG